MTSGEIELQTKLEKKNICLKWTMAEFKENLMDFRQLRSVFQSGDESLECTVDLYPKGKSGDGRLELWWRFDMDCPFAIGNTCLEFQDVNGKNIRTVDSDLSIEKSKEFEVANFRETPSEIFDDLAEDTLVLLGTINVKIPTVTVSASNKSTSEETDSDYKKDSQWKNNMLKILETEVFADVIVEADGKEFAVHQVVLAAGSSEFEKRLKLDTSVHGVGKRLEITDVLPNTLKELFKFLYTREEPNFANMRLDMVFGLVAASTDYGVNGLLSFAVRYLIDTLSENNVVDVLLVADKHSLEDLKQKAAEFLYAHKGILSDNEKCKNLQTNPELMREIMCHISQV